MNLLKRIFTITAVACFACLLMNNSVNAHDFLKEPIKDRYGLKSASCYVCHPGSNKAINNSFGMKFKTAFKGKNYTKRVDAAKTLKKKDKEAGENALNEIEVEMVAHFNEIIGEIEQTKMSVVEMAKAGMLNGTKLTPEAIEVMRVDQGAPKKK